MLLGRVCDVLQTGSNDICNQGRVGQEVLLPALKSVVKNVQLEQQRRCHYPERTVG